MVGVWPEVPPKDSSISKPSPFKMELHGFCLFCSFFPLFFFLILLSILYFLQLKSTIRCPGDRSFMNVSPHCFFHIIHPLCIMQHFRAGSENESGIFIRPRVICMTQTKLERGKTESWGGEKMGVKRQKLPYTHTDSPHVFLLKSLISVFFPRLVREESKKQQHKYL